MTVITPRGNRGHSTIGSGQQQAGPPGPANQAGRGSALQSPALVGALAGLQAAVVGLAVLMVPVVGVWLATPGSVIGWPASLRLTALFWLAAHGTSLSLLSGELSVAPLGLTALCAWLCTVFARRVARALRLVDHGSRTSRTVLAQAGFLVAYGSVLIVTSVASATDAVRAQTETALLGGLVVAGLASAAGLWSHGGWWRRRSVGAASARQVDWLRAGLAAVMFLVAVGVLLLGGLTLAGYARIQALYDGLHPGFLGGLGLGALQFSLLPDLAVWVLAWLAGPGFMVGTGTSVTTSHVVLGPVPALPILGALPEPGLLPAWVGLAATGILVVAGALGGRVLGLRHRRDLTPAGAALVDVLAAALVTGLMAWVLVWFASGALGAGPMSQWGARGWLVGLLVAGKAGVGMLLTASVIPGLRRRRASRDPQ